MTRPTDCTCCYPVTYRNGHGHAANCPAAARLVRESEARERALERVEAEMAQQLEEVR
jgi:hypothetical protein